MSTLLSLIITGRSHRTSHTILIPTRCSNGIPNSHLRQINKSTLMIYHHRITHVD
ncbi:hypothetical protein PG987_003405 [Apiospora arundinis]